jgi:hypothetical protein
MLEASPHDPSRALERATMSHDLHKQATQAITARDQAAMKALAPRLAELDDDRALELLLEIFVLEWEGRDRAGLRALIHSVAPGASLALVQRLPGWVERKKAGEVQLGRLLAEACQVLSARGDAAALPGLVEATGLAGDDRLLSQRLLVARMALGDEPAAEELRQRWLRPCYSGEDKIGKEILERSAPEVAYRFLAPIVRAHQGGDDSLRDTAAKLLFDLTTPEHRWGGPDGTERIELPLPPRDPAWFELGLELLEQRPRPHLHGYLRPLLALPHPRREELLEAASQRYPHAGLLTGLRPPAGHPLLAHLDPERLESHGVVPERFRQEPSGEWTLLARSGRLVELSGILEGLGERASLVTGIDFGGRAMPPNAAELVAAWEDLGRFRRLSLKGSVLKLPALRKLLKSPHLGAVEQLDLGFTQLTGTGLAALGKARTLPRLRSLLLACDEGRHSASDLEALVQGPALAGLEELSLAGWRLEGGWRALGGSTLGRNLLCLDLSEQHHLGHDLARLLHCLAEHDARLETLKLGYSFQGVRQGSDDWNHWLDDQAQQRPVTPLAGLRRLELAVVDGPMLAALLGASIFPGLTALDLSDSTLAGEDLALFAAQDPPSALAELRLRHVQRIDRAAIERLAAWPQAARLELLDVGGRTDLRSDALEGLPDGMVRAIEAAGWPD